MSCLCILAITPIFIPAKNMLLMWVLCSATLKMLCCQTGRTCLLVITEGLHPLLVSGTNFHRPKGQMTPPNTEKPVFGPSKALDIELEMAFIIGKIRTWAVVLVPKMLTIIFLAWCCLMIGQPGIYNVGNMFRLVPFLRKTFASTFLPG